MKWNPDQHGGETYLAGHRIESGLQTFCTEETTFRARDLAYDVALAAARVRRVVPVGDVILCRVGICPEEADPLQDMV